MEQNNLPNETPPPETARQAESPYLIPVSVIVAGILIAGAVIYSNKSGNQTPPVAGQPQGLTMAAITDAAKDALPAADQKAFLDCANGREFRNRVQSDQDNGIAAGVDGTPHTIVIGKNGQRYAISGARSYAEVDAVIQDALKGINGLGKSDPAYKARPIDATDHILGNANAPVKIIEYSDLQCPFCRLFQPTLRQIMNKYGANGQAAWVYRHFPLDNLHPLARPAAEASECVNKLGGNDAFWKFVDEIFVKAGE